MSCRSQGQQERPQQLDRSRQHWCVPARLCIGSHHCGDHLSTRLKRVLPCLISNLVSEASLDLRLLKAIVQRMFPSTSPPASCRLALPLPALS